MNVWPARLGHIGQKCTNQLAKEDLLGSLDKVEISTCEHCLAGKIARKPFRKGTKDITPLQLIHSNICGPMNVKAKHWVVYFITFIDDFTRYCYVYLISHKSQTLDCFI